jgi:hypothetical protein
MPRRLPRQAGCTSQAEATAKPAAGERHVSEGVKKICAAHARCELDIFILLE